MSCNSHKTSLICLSPRHLPLPQPCLSCQSWDSLGSRCPPLTTQESSVGQEYPAGLAHLSWSLELCKEARICFFSLVGYLGSRMELQGWTESPGFINSINSISNSFHVEPPWCLSSFQQQCQLWTSHLNHHQGPLTLLLTLGGFSTGTALLVGQSTQGGSCRSLSHPSLYSFWNLKERQHPMLFSWDGSGTETTRYFRTSEPGSITMKKIKNESVYTLVLSSLLTMLL